MKIRRVLFELRQEFDRRRIHLTEALCSELDKCIKALWEPTVAAGIWPGVNNPEYRQQHSEEFKKAMMAVIEGGAVEIAIANVEGAFRSALRGPAGIGLQPTATGDAVSRRG